MDNVLAPMTGRLPSLARPRMPPLAAKEAGSRDLREKAGKGAQSAEFREKRAKGAPTRESPKPGWALSLEGLEAMSPKQCHRHLLFGDLLEDVGAAASIFPRESAELGYRMPDPRAWTQSLEPSAARQDRLLGVLKAAEARGRVRALRLRYTYMRVRRGGQKPGRAWEKVGQPAGARPPGPEERGGDWLKQVGLARAPCGSGGWRRGPGGRAVPCGRESGRADSLGFRTAPQRPPPPPRPTGGGDLASHPATEVRARRHPAGAVPATAAEAHADPGPSGPPRGAYQPGKGRTGGAPRPAHLAPAPLPQRRRVETILEEKVDGRNFLR